jgi:tetratricopeptide (TPR) repeat protein
MHLRTLVLTIFLAAASLAASAQRAVSANDVNPMRPVEDNMASINGSLRTGDNKPARDAHVEIRDLTTGKRVADGYTNQSGTFDFINIPTGTYEVVAVSGLEEARERVEVRGAGASVNMRFPAAQGAEAGTRATVSVAQFKVPGKARDAFKKAQSAIAKQELDKASKYVDEALTLHPEYSEALALRGVLKLDAGNAEAACEDFDHAIKVDASNAMAYIAMGAALNMLSKYDDALRTIDRGVALAPTSWQGYFEMGKAFLGKGSFDAALRQLNKAEDIGPKEYALIHLVKAHALLGLKNYPEAMAELQWYLEKAPSDANSAEARKTLEQVRAFAATAPAE